MLGILFVVWLLFAVSLSGPAKSTLMCEYGGASLRQNGDNGGGMQNMVSLEIFNIQCISTES